MKSRAFYVHLRLPRMAQKARYRDPAQRRLYPVSTFNSMCARPLSRLLAPVLSPNQVSLLSLLTSLAGLWLVASGAWNQAAMGVGLVHLGLLLDHADGQVARRTGKGSTWGMYLDMVIDRIVEIGLVVALAVAVTIESPWLSPWIHGDLVWLVPVTVATMMLWRFLTAYNDVLYLRSHLLSTGAPPPESAKPKALAKRPLFPFIFNRDWVLLLWSLGVLLGQVHATLWLLLVLHALSCIEKIIVFKARHDDPEGDAARILKRDYH